MTEKEYITERISEGKAVLQNDNEFLAQYLINCGIRYFPNQNLALSKLENYILRAIMDIKNNEYDSAEECLMKARKILEGKAEQKEILEGKEES